MSTKYNISGIFSFIKNYRCDGVDLDDADQAVINTLIETCHFYGVITKKLDTPQITGDLIDKYGKSSIYGTISEYSTENGLKSILHFVKIYKNDPVREITHNLEMNFDENFYHGTFKDNLDGGFVNCQLTTLCDDLFFTKEIEAKLLNILKEEQKRIEREKPPPNTNDVDDVPF